MFAENRKKGLKRRARISRAVDLQQHGYTDGCPGCDAAAKSAKAVGHSDACRQRIETVMAGDDVAAAKLLRAQNRRGEFHGAVLTARILKCEAFSVFRGSQNGFPRDLPTTAISAERVFKQPPRCILTGRVFKQPPRSILVSLRRLPDLQQFLEIDTRPKPLRNRIENAPF